MATDLSSSSSSSSTTINSISNEMMLVSESNFSPSIVHSRNSSKTLKCPKCNWHYKYQETLEIHMKEKHQLITNNDGNPSKSIETDSNCSYCLTNSIHPRLARGEQYPCGFKPYRCDLCLYSTTTKGNLAIHMQSDKHINNTKDLSSPPPPSSSSQQFDQTSSQSQQEMKLSNSSPSNDSIQCPLCSLKDFTTTESLKEHLTSVHNCKNDSLQKCLALIEDSGISSMIIMSDNANYQDEYRCHSCPNTHFKDLQLLFSHLQQPSHNNNTNESEEDNLNEDNKSVGLLCWKKGCNQYFQSMENLQKHFQEIHLANEFDSSREKDKEKTNQQNFLSKSRERLFSIGEDVVLHYLENLNSSNSTSNEILCDLCLKSFSSLSTLKVHYEDIHSIVLSSRAIQHWIFLLQKLHSSSTNENNKLKRQSSSSSIVSTETKKSRSTNPFEDIYSSALNYPLVHSFDLSNNNNKRQRTRITDQQLQILRAHFNINNSPTDEQIFVMSQKTQLSTKVIKHWFRNTLFKERQRNKDSPYNFSNPPSNFNKFDFDEYQKTGTIVKKYQLNQSDESDNDLTSTDEQDLLSDDENHKKQTSASSLGNSTNSSRRANRTRFSDQQLKLLQDAFEANPYPKDDDLEILSDKLKLNSRVIVVWFQNARQKARKSYENNQTDNSTNNNNNNNNNEPTQFIIKQDKDDGYSCKNCHKLFTRFAELMKHAKQCSSSTTSTTNHHKKSSSSSSNKKRDCLSSVDSLKSPSTFVVPSHVNEKKDNYCDQCDQQFSSKHLFIEHQNLHMQAILNAAAFFPLAAYHPAAAAATAAAMAHFQSQLIQQPFKDLRDKEIRNVPSNDNKINSNHQPFSSSFASDSENQSSDDDEQSLDSNDENKKFNLSNTHKRNRTTILPEQQDYLMLKYSQESNPSRKMLEDISSQVKLKKRVVQVWFQNTRARERKGNIKFDHNSSTNEYLNKKCLHCSFSFKSKTTIEQHLLSKHSDIYTNKDQLQFIDFDVFPSSQQSTDELPLDLSKTSTNSFDENKFENEQSNDSTCHSNDDSQLCIFNKQKSFSSSSSFPTHPPHLPPPLTTNNGHLSPTDSQQSSNGFNSQRRFRTQMSPLQIKLMKAIFLEYRTPTMPECELLGKEIDLQKRVVQVWFQNARAKEKKNANFFKSDLPQEYQPTNDFCHLCQFKYSIQNPQRDHLFTSKHIDNIRSILSKQQSNNNSTNKDEHSFKKNSQLDIEHSPTSTQDQQNQIMSYLNLMQLMPITGIDPYNYGLMDPNIHGTPLFMLHLPTEALNKIISLNKSDVHLTSVQYTQDNLHIQQLTDNGHQNIDYQTIDVGFACKRCNLVWPLYESCRCHALLCWQISSSTLPMTINNSDDLNQLSTYIFKIEQLLYRCLTCQTSFSTVQDYEKHTKDQIHCKNLSKNATTNEND